MSTELLSQKALANFKGGYNCAQSVLLALTEHIDPENKNEFIPKIAAGFGSGMSGCGSVCGALIGGVMAVGIEYGSNDADPKKRMPKPACLCTNNSTSAIAKQQHGCILCKDLKSKQKSLAQPLVESVIQTYIALEKALTAPFVFWGKLFFNSFIFSPFQ